MSTRKRATSHSRRGHSRPVGRRTQLPVKRADALELVIGQRLALARKALGLSVSAAAELAGVSESTVRRLERLARR